MAQYCGTGFATDMRIMKRAALLLTILFAACGPILPIENPFQVPENEFQTDTALKSLRIIVLDVGQGDATLVIGPTGRTLLIDGGPPETGSPVVLEKLAEEGIESLDWIVASHYDIDHIGGLPTILERYPPTISLLDRGDQTTQDHPLFSDYIEIGGSFRETAEPGQVLPLGVGAEAVILMVNGHYRDGRRVATSEENEASIVLLIRYGNLTYLTTGDLPGDGEDSRDLESHLAELVGDVDILHVGHHGSNSSTGERFLSLIRPETAVISVGRDNPYNHPAEGVLARLRQIGSEIYRTDLHGTIEIDSDGELPYISTKTTQTHSRVVGARLAEIARQPTVPPAENVSETVSFP